MKRVSLFVFVVVVPLFIAKGQVQIGAKGGINFAKWVNPGPLDQGVEWNTLAGSTGGVFAAYQFTGIFGVQVEANYIQKGFHLIYPFVRDADIKMSVVEFPISLRVSLNTPLIRPYALAGVAYGFLLQARIKGTDLISHASIDYDYKDAIRKNDISAQIAIGGEYDFFPGIDLLLDARYSMGLRTIENYSGGTVKTRGIQLQAGIVMYIP